MEATNEEILNEVLEDNQEHDYDIESAHASSEDLERDLSKPIEQSRPKTAKNGRAEPIKSWTGNPTSAHQPAKPVAPMVTGNGRSAARLTSANRKENRYRTASEFDKYSGFFARTGP
jgi:hypothetical protein